MVNASCKSFLLHVPRLLLMVCWLLPATGRTQHEHSADELEKGLAHTHGLVASLKSDSAILLADSLIGILREKGELGSPFGLELQLATATARGNDNQDSTAMVMLLQIREESRKQELWKTYAYSGLALADLYENIKRRESARDALREVSATIATYGLDSIYPAYALRMSNWNRSFSKNRDSAIYYAREVIRTAPRYGDSILLVNGYMMMGFQTDKTPEISIAYFRQGIELCRRIGDHVGASYMLSGLATRMMAQDRYEEALLYNDSSILAAQRAVGEGRVSGTAVSDALQDRGEIYHSLGMLDSAYYYMHKGHDLEIDNMRELERQKALEIDARYNDQLKAGRIAEQSRELRDEARMINLLLLVVGLGLVLGLVLAYTTARFRNLNQENEEQAKQLRSLDAAKSRFFANVSHELRTPLTLIQGPIQSLRNDDNLTARQQELLHLASSNGDKLQELIGQILELQKMEAGKPDLNTTLTPLRDYLEHCVVHFSALAQQKEVEYGFDLSLPPGLHARIDREKYRIILANLLANAFKFTRAGGEVAVSITYSNPDLRIEVRDTGSGIHADDLPHVFDRFYQTKRTDRPAEGGTGIGLALCKEYVGLFGGTIEVESQEGQGATFRVKIPILAEFASTPSPERITFGTSPTPAPVARAAHHPAQGGEAPRILVVEDNPDLQEYLRFILSDHYRVETAGNGQQALDRLRALPDCRLVLSDIMMPVMDGYQLLRELKSGETTGHLPVIMLTARGDAGDRLRALRIGVDDYLTKPFEEEELLVRIANLLKNQDVRTATEAEVQESGEPTPVISADDREWLEGFEAFVRQHIANHLLTVPYLANAFAMSESTLLRQVKRLTGLTTLQYLQDIRLNEARKVLESTASPSIAQLAAEVGYRDARSFSRAFRNRFGKLPSEHSGADAGGLPTSGGERECK